MAKVRIGHFVEAQIIEAIGADYIDESEVLTPADDKYHIDVSRSSRDHDRVFCMTFVLSLCPWLLCHALKPEPTLG